MSILSKICFNPIFASQFMKPSGIFGKLVSKLMKDHNFFVYKEIEQFTDFKRNDQILEIGFGPGVGILYFMEKYDIKIDGVDFSKLMVSEATKLNSKFIEEERLNLYCAPFETMDFGSKKYDKIIFANVIYFWKDPEPVFAKIKNLLTEQGKLVFYMSNKQLLDKIKVADNPLFIKYSAEYVLKILSKNQFHNIRAHNIINTNNEFLIIYAENKNKR